MSHGIKAKTEISQPQMSFQIHGIQKLIPFSSCRGVIQRTSWTKPLIS